MASIYKRTNSPYWWVKYRDPATGKHVAISSKIKLTDPKNKIQTKLARYELEERLTSRSKAKTGAFKNWVPMFIDTHYKCGKRNKISYGHLTRFFKTENIVYPDQIDVHLYSRYLLFRIAEGVVKNTVNREFAFLKVLMRHADDAGYLAKNPFLNLRVKWDTSKEKNTISDSEIKLIRGTIIKIQNRNHFFNKKQIASASGIYPEQLSRLLRGKITLQDHPDIAKKLQAGYKKLGISISVFDDPFLTDPSYWVGGRFDKNKIDFLSDSLTIMWSQGLRVGEIYFDLYRDVNLKNKTLRILAKGDRYYHPPIHPVLFKKIEQWKKAGRTHSLPSGFEKSHTRSWVWAKFFKSLDLRHLSAHCFRVTFISRAINAGVPMGKVMRLTNHSRESISLIYQKFDRSQMDDIWDKLEN